MGLSEDLRDLDRSINFNKQLESSDVQKVTNGLVPSVTGDFMADFIKDRVFLDRLDPIEQFVKMHKPSIGVNKAITWLLLSHMTYFHMRNLEARRRMLLDPIETAGIYQVLAKDEILPNPPRHMPTGVFFDGFKHASFLSIAMVAVNDPAWIKSRNGFNYYINHRFHKDLYGKGDTLWLRSLGKMLRNKDLRLGAFLDYDMKQFFTIFCVPNDLYEDSFATLETRSIRIQRMPFDFSAVQSLVEQLIEEYKPKVVAEEPVQKADSPSLRVQTLEQLKRWLRIG